MTNIKTIRNQKKLTQAQLAEMCGLSQAYINELENGKKANPSTIVLRKLACALDVTIMILLDEEQVSA